MPILPAERKRIARRIGESGGRSVNDLGYERERLQCSGAKFFEKKQRREVIKLAFVRNCEHGAEPLQVDVLRANIVSSRNDEPARLIYGCVGMLPRQLEQRVLRRLSCMIDEIHDHALV